MVWGLLAGALLGGASSVYSSKKSADVAKDEGARNDALEREKYEEGKRQAELLRQQGKESAAQAVEEGLRADLGAQRFEEYSTQWAQREGDFARRTEAVGANLYKKERDAAKALQAAGDKGANAIMDASGRVMDQAVAGDARLTSAFQNTQNRFSPFMKSEADSLAQLRVEMGLDEGDVNRSYRESNPAYQEYMDASRVNQDEAEADINQMAGNSGTLYSGSRGAALMDRYKRGDNERAGIEQSYYQMYMDKLGQMANPTATSAVSSAELNTADKINNNYMNAAGTGVNAAQAAENTRLGSMMTGREGQQLTALMRDGTEGRDVFLGGLDTGTAGSPYRLTGENFNMQGAGSAANAILPNMPTGAGSPYRMAAAEAKSAGIADAVGGATNLYSLYMQNQKPQNPAPGYSAYQMPNSWGVA